ncbi:hypothetical protein [Burkholderia glumae]|uniref:hypothetical protein n=1 Tax=Burkholderia glumae TaxID=337 RepID=UPI00157B8558|nr:hypothetical protein [Burkholderia glumae]QKM47740.1 hypothetical protein B7760_01764 [Burkholderia glumae]
MADKHLDQFTAGQVYAIKHLLGVLVVAAPDTAVLRPLLDAAQQAAEARALPEPVSEKFLDGSRDVFAYLRVLLEQAAEPPRTG